MLFDRVAFDDYFQDARAMSCLDGTGALGEKHVRGITEVLVEWILANKERAGSRA
jgi:hypothetical protein